MRIEADDLGIAGERAGRIAPARVIREERVRLPVKAPASGDECHDTVGGMRHVVPQLDEEAFATKSLLPCLAPPSDDDQRSLSCVPK